MIRKVHPDHAGRMPDHPRYGNPSDEAEEASRILDAQKNLDDWQDKYGGQFSGSVSMSYGRAEGEGRKYSVKIGDPVISDKVSSRPIAAPPVPPPLPEPSKLSGFAWLISLIKGVFR